MLLNLEGSIFILLKKFEVKYYYYYFISLFLNIIYFSQNTFLLFYKIEKAIFNFITFYNQFYHSFIIIHKIFQYWEKNMEYKIILSVEKNYDQ